MMLGILFISIFAYIEVVKCTATINVQLIRYSNPTHRLSSGRCCEQGIEPLCRRNGGTHCAICTLECDNLFHISLTKLNGNNSSDKRSLIYIETGVLAYKDELRFPTNLTKTIDNPLRYQVDAYKGSFQLEVTSFDEDENNDTDFVDSSRLTFNQSVIPSYLNDAVKIVDERVLVGNVSFVNVSIWVQCDQYYHTSSCDVFCKRQNDLSGHFTCNPLTGGKICLAGWQNQTTNCTTTDIAWKGSTNIEVFTIVSTSIQKSTPSLTMQPSSIMATIYQSSTNIPSLTLSQLITTSTRNIAGTSSVKVVRHSTIPTTISTTVVQKCNKANFSADIFLTGAFPNNRKISETLQEIFCISINKQCLGITVETCPTSIEKNLVGMKDISLQDIETNMTHFKTKLFIPQEHSSCLPAPITIDCIETALFVANEKKETLNIHNFKLCSSASNDCQKKHYKLRTPENKENSGRHTVLIVCLVVGMFFVLLAVVAAVMFTRKKKRSMKISHLEESVSSHSTKEDGSDTSSC